MKRETCKPQPVTLPGLQFPVRSLFARIGIACRGLKASYLDLKGEPEARGLLHGQHQPPDGDHQSLLHRILLWGWQRHPSAQMPPVEALFVHTKKISLVPCAVF